MIRTTRVMTQGMTGKTGLFHTKNCIEYALGKECFVAGVTPGKGGKVYEDIPVYDTVAEAKEQTGANVSVIYVPPPFAAAAIDEAVEAGLDLGYLHYRRRPGKGHGIDPLQDGRHEIHCWWAQTVRA